MKKPILILSLLFASVIARAQRNDTTIYLKCGPKPTGIMIGQTINIDEPSADVCPSFPYGYDKLDRLLSKNFKFNSNEKFVRVFVECVIEKNGRVNPFHIIRGQSPEMNREAIRLIRSLPKWIPAKVKKHPVRMRYILPVKFRVGY
ncbi:MAG: energy transducer TonB [Mucilaginibacter sp.]